MKKDRNLVNLINYVVLACDTHMFPSIVALVRNSKYLLSNGVGLNILHNVNNNLKYIMSRHLLTLPSMFVV